MQPLSYKTRIYPTPEQEEVLWKLSNQCRLLYNFALLERMSEWYVNKKSVTCYKQINDLKRIKKKYPNYEWVYSKVLQTTLEKLDGAYGSFYTLNSHGDKDARPPGYRGRDYFFTMNYNQSGFKLSKNKVKFSQYYTKEVTLEFDAEIPEFDKVKQIEIFQDNNKYFVSIGYEIETPEYVDNELYQAWDLGVTKQTGVNSEGKYIEIKNIRPDLYWKKKISSLQSRRDHCKKKDGRKKNCRKSSIKWVQMDNLKKKCERRSRNQILDFQHKMTTMIVNNTKANTIFIGDLSVKDMPKSDQANRSLNRGTQNTGYLGRMAQFLIYKAPLVGKKATKIDESYTSKTCGMCGRVHYMPLYQRNMNCECGNKIDRDRNSANSIMMLALSQNALWQSYQKFSNNLLKTTNLEILPPEKLLSVFGNLRNTGRMLSMSVHSQEAPSARVGWFT
jgi:putative transposase